MRRPTRPGRQGFTAVETLVAILILSLMGLLMGNTLMKTTQAIRHRDDRRRAASLAAMVFEQYKSYAAMAYDDLPSHDQTAIAPKDFFHTPDDLGYDGLSITTQTHCAADGSSCTVLATIAKGHHGTATFSKTYTEAPLGDSAREVSGI